ncbi:MAG: response regulator [Anaerolineales bacterium]
MTGTVLIVDDDPAAMATMEAVLTGQGYQLEFADNGPLALTKADSIMPDLILLDVMMPGMNGLEVCKRIRATPKLAEIPIIILTALDDRDSRLVGIEAGADDFFTKPLDTQELRLRVKTILRLNRYRTLMTQRENLQKMAWQVITAQEEERKRISRELHDDLGQALIAHVLNLRNLQENLHTKDRAVLDGLIIDANQTLSKMRMLAQDLRPALLETLGLKKALATYCDEFKSRTGLHISFETDENFPELSDVYSITLYRFLQETLTNVIKHSKATHVWVDLSIEENEIILTVQDNGVGLPKINSTEHRGIGLIGLQERLIIVGGKLRTNSPSANGSIISAHLPLEKIQFQGE